MPNREDELWALIRFNRSASPEQIMAWCKELIAILEKTGKDIVFSKSIEDSLKEMLQELDLLQLHKDIVCDTIRLLITRQDNGKKSKASKR